MSVSIIDSVPLKCIFKNTTYPSILEKGKGVEVVKERFLELPLIHLTVFCSIFNKIFGQITEDIIVQVFPRTRQLARDGSHAKLNCHN